MPRTPAKPIYALLAVVVAVALAGCGRSGASAVPASGAGATAKLQVVAAENFWGSIASQLGGTKAVVKSIIVNPNADPHTY